MKIRLAGIVPESIVDGPGFRYAIFTQGCPHKCEGCHNPQTHDFNGGYLEDTDKLFAEIRHDKLLDGVTFSGGDPFCQCRPLIDLAKRIRKELPRLNIMSYTGYTYEQLMSANAPEGSRELLGLIDYLVDGKFILAQKSLELKFKGSANQRFIDVPQTLKQGRVVEVDTTYL